MASPRPTGERYLEPGKDLAVELTKNHPFRGKSGDFDLGMQGKKERRKCITDKCKGGK